MTIEQKLLKIRRDFLKGKHKEADAILDQDKLSNDDVNKLKYHYEVSAEYAELLRELVTTDIESMNKEIKKIMKTDSAKISFDGIIGKLKDHLDKNKNKSDK